MNLEFISNNLSSIIWQNGRAKMLFGKVERQT